MSLWVKALGAVSGLTVCPYCLIGSGLLKKVLVTFIILSTALVAYPASAKPTPPRPAFDPVTVLTANALGEALQWQHEDAYLQGLQRYDDALVQYQADLDAEAAERAAQAAKPAPQRVVTTPPVIVQAPAPVNDGSWASFAACVIAHESGGNPTAQNPSSSASGLFQDLDSTWGGYGGYARAKDAPVDVQYARNYALWNGGAGASNWRGTNCPGT